MSLIVLHESEDLLAIHKPEFVPFHSSDSEEGVVQRLRRQFNNDYLYPIHRLDKMTSGLMVFAKNQRTNKALSEMLAAKQVEKYYLAASHKKPNKRQGTVKGDMEKARNGSYKLARTCENPAITRFYAHKLRQNSHPDSKGSEASLNKPGWVFILKPESGKTHQLRVALKSLGSPITGDTRYGGEAASRGMLHAYCMRFRLFDEIYLIRDTILESEELSFVDFERSIDGLNEPSNLAWPRQSFLLTE